MKKRWIAIIISLVTLCAVLIGTFLLVNNKKDEDESFTSQKIPPLPTITSLAGYYIGVKNAGVGEATEPVVIASITSEKSSDGTVSDYFSVEQLNENEVTDMPIEVDNLHRNQELVNKTFTNFVRIDNSSFGFVMNDKKDGELMGNIALFYRPIPTEKQYYLALDEDYLLVMASPEKLKSLGQVTPTELRNNILKKQFGLLDSQEISTAVNGTSLKHNHSATSLITH